MPRVVYKQYILNPDIQRIAFYLPAKAYRANKVNIDRRMTCLPTSSSINNRQRNWIPSLALSYHSLTIIPNRRWKFSRYFQLATLLHCKIMCWVYWMTFISCRETLAQTLWKKKCVEWSKLFGAVPGNHHYFHITIFYGMSTTHIVSVFDEEW